MNNRALSRRTLVAGAAWATPAVMAASAAPALAASPAAACVSDGQATFTGTSPTSVDPATGQPLTGFTFQTNPSDPSVTSSLVELGFTSGGTVTSDATSVTVDTTTRNEGSTPSVGLALVTDPGVYTTRLLLTLQGVTADQILTDNGVVIVSESAAGVVVDVTNSDGNIFFADTVNGTVTITDPVVETGSAVYGQDPAACGGATWGVGRETKIRQ